MDIDLLTGVGSKTLFDRRLAAACGAISASSAPLTLLRIEVDRYADLVAQLGQSIGDGELVRLARSFERCIRAGDTIAKIDQAEFALLLPDTDASVGADLAERCRTAACGNDVSSTRVTVSVGYVTVWQATAPLDLFAEAGAALREAQASGGNIVAMFRPASR